MSENTSANTERSIQRLHVKTELTATKQKRHHLVLEENGKDKILARFRNTECMYQFLQIFKRLGEVRCGSIKK